MVLKPWVLIYNELKERGCGNANDSRIPTTWMWNNQKPKQGTQITYGDTLEQL